MGSSVKKPRGNPPLSRLHEMAFEPERNLALLQAHDPELALQLNRLLSEQRERSLPSAFVFNAITPGQVRCRRREEESGWIHGPDAPEAEALMWIASASVTNAKTVVVWQGGLGYAPRLLRRNYPDKRLIVCETRCELLWEWLCRWDGRDVLEATPCWLAGGEDAWKRLQDLVRQYPVLFRSAAVVQGSHLSPADARLLEEMREGIERGGWFPPNEAVAPPGEASPTSRRTRSPPGCADSRRPTRAPPLSARPTTRSPPRTSATPRRSRTSLECSYPKCSRLPRPPPSKNRQIFGENSPEMGLT